MRIEQRVNQKLNEFPAAKRKLKRIYQKVMYSVSKKITSEGAISKISPDDSNYEYFFGYYDKSPWDVTDRFILCMRAKNTWSDVSPRETADILLIDTEKEKEAPGRIQKIAETRAWNVQQGCMLQWMGPEYGDRILYNDYRNNRFVSIIFNLKTRKEEVFDAPVYSVSSDGTFALTLDFSRLYNLRPGYGYYNVKEVTEGINLPNTTAIWKIDFLSGEIIPVLKYTDFAAFQPRKEMQGKDVIHKINHIMISPNGKRFMVLYRWFRGQRKFSRLITCNTDGTDMYLLSDDDMVSHCFWKNNLSILAFENKKKNGPGYYLMKDKTQKYIHCWPQLSDDGHPSYSPDGKKIVTDTYPNKSRIACIRIMDGDERKEEVQVIARVFAPFKYDNDTRCDLHPRWNRNSNQICFDSVFEGTRGLYVVDLNERRQRSENNRKRRVDIVKSIVRNSANFLRRNIIKDGKMQKLLSVKYNNLQVLKQKKKGPVNELFNYKKIIAGPKIFLCTEYYKGNSHFGIAKVLQEYCGFGKSINACIEHGVYFGNYVCEGEAVKSGLNGVLTFSSQRKKHLQSIADVPVIPIGPYICYAAPLLSDHEIEEIKIRNGKTLLVFPSHSIDRVDVEFDMEDFALRIYEFAKDEQFKSVYVCLFYKDILLGRDKIYMDRGFRVVTAGYRGDPLFLRRLKTFILISDFTVSNEVGTHIGYCIALKKGHYIFDQVINHKAYTKMDLENITSSFNSTVSKERLDVKQKFTDIHYEITEEQYEVVNKYWGLEFLRTSQELYEILSGFEK